MIDGRRGGKDGGRRARTRKPDTIMIIINFTDIYYWLSFIFIQYYWLSDVRICPAAIERRERDEVVRDTGAGACVYKSRKQRRYAILKYKVD